MLRFPLARAVSSTEALMDASPVTVRVELPPDEEILQLVPEVPVCPVDWIVRLGKSEVILAYPFPVRPNVVPPAGLSKELSPLKFEVEVNTFET